MEEVDEDSYCTGGDSKTRGWKGGKGTVLWPKKGLDGTMEHEAPPTGALPYNTVPTVVTVALELGLATSTTLKRVGYCHT